MCKFHASGREDMDVRMLLPPGGGGDTGGCGTAGGRPFVCEVFDAHRMPTTEDLARAAARINRTDDDGGGSEGAEAGGGMDAGEMDVRKLEVRWGVKIDGALRAELSAPRHYGRNPGGVGVSGLEYRPSSAFKNLQAETEDKVKHYGCVCWSEVPIPTQEYLEERLGCGIRISPDGGGGDGGGGGTTSRYPLEILQSTPLRVLHRRASAVRARRILTLSATRLDDRWFALRLSTSAGTYVKEFVHGDCGRTAPSAASMLGGRADIVRLDCEGIDV